MNDIERIEQEIRVYTSAKNNMDLSKEDRDYAEEQIKKLKNDLRERECRVHSADALLQKVNRESAEHADNNEEKVEFKLPVSWCLAIREILDNINGYVNNCYTTPNATEIELHNNINILVAQSGFACQDENFDTEGEEERDMLGKEFIKQVIEEINFVLRNYADEKKKHDNTIPMSVDVRRNSF